MDSINALKAYFNSKKITITPDILNELKKQSLLPFLHYVANDSSFDNYYLAATLIQEKYLFLETEITNILNTHFIKHIYLKGAVINALYDDPILRTRGDIDLYIIDIDEFEKGVRLLKENNYKLIEKNYLHYTFFKNGLEIELHSKLLSKDYKNKEYFNNFSFIHFNNSLYKLDDNINYIYNIWHLHKHILSGEGLRYLLDFYYMQKKLNLDFTFIKNELSKFNLNLFHEHIINAIYIITNDKLNGFSNEKDDLLLNYLNDSGIHGKNTNNYENVINNSYNNKFSYLMNRIFLLDKDERASLYPKLSKNILLYPILLIHRIFYLIFNKFKKLKYIFKAKKKDNRVLIKDLGVVEL